MHFIEISFLYESIKKNNCDNIIFNYVYLDIQRQLPSEFKLFSQVDKSWKDIMRRTEDRANALKSATAQGVLEMLQAANLNLEKVYKCLEVSTYMH